jgi:hypothetical protein
MVIGYSTQQPIGYNRFNLKWAFVLLMCFGPFNITIFGLILMVLGQKDEYSPNTWLSSPNPRTI